MPGPPQAPIRQPVLDRLRRGTADIHAHLDESLPLTSPTLDPATYLAILSGFHAIQTAADRALAPHAQDLAAYGYDVHSRHESAWLDHDFEWWGSRGADVALVTAATFPEVASTADAFGWVYVLEGSTLGGQVILRHVARTLQLDPPDGCRYFVSHGDDVGPRWRRTCQSIDAFAAAGSGDASEENTQSMVRAARELFSSIDTILNQAPV